MPRQQKTQKSAKSCGAATTLCAQAELGMDTPVTNANENVIWSAICMKKGTVPDAIVGETLPHSVAAWFQARGRNADIIESPNTHGGNNPLTTQYPALEPLYQLYHAGANASAVNVVSADPSNAHIANGERLFLVAKLDGQAHLSG